MDEELPSTDRMYELMQKVGMPMLARELGWTDQDVRDAFCLSRNARDKYLTSSLLWDMGMLQEMAREMTAD
jgi:glycerol-1-phosphate dehydrogenase [NAD(P)+]